MVGPGILRRSYRLALVLGARCLGLSDATRPLSLHTTLFLKLRRRNGRFGTITIRSEPPVQFTALRF